MIAAIPALASAIPNILSVSLTTFFYGALRRV
jgi:hypothetical protein